MEDKYIWKIERYKPKPIVGFVYSIFLIIFSVNLPLNTALLVPVIFLGFLFFMCGYEVLKFLFLSYPIQINICSDCLEIVYSKGTAKRVIFKEIKRIEFHLEHMYRATPYFEFYDSKDKLIIAGDVRRYEQFQEVYSQIRCISDGIFIPDDVEDYYISFGGLRPFIIPGVIFATFVIIAIIFTFAL